MAAIGSLTVKLGLVTVEWDKATDKAKKDAKELEKAFGELGDGFKELYGHWKMLGGAVGASAVGFAVLLDKTIEFSSELKDLADGFEISIGKALQFQNALATSGGKAENASKMLSTLFQRLDEVNVGNEQTIAKFQRLGLTFEEISQLKPEDAINKVAAAIAKLPDAIQKAAAIKEFFGKGGVGVDIEEFSKKVAESTAANEKHAESIRKLAEVSDGLKTSTRNLEIAFADIISIFAHDGIVSIEKFKASLLAMGSAAAVGGIINVTMVVLKLVTALKEGAKLAFALTALQGVKGLAQVAIATGVYFGASKYFENQKEQEQQQQENRTSQSFPIGGGNDEKFTIARRELVALQSKIDLTKKLADIDEAQIQLKIDALTKDKYANEAAAIQLNLKSEIFKLESQRFQNLNKENLSDEQKLLINQDIDEQISRARKKSILDQRLLNEQKKLETKILQDQFDYQKKKFAFEKEGYALKLRSINEDKYVIELANAELKKREEIAAIQMRLGTEITKANNSYIAREFARKNAGEEMQAAIDKEKADREYILATKEKELRVMSEQAKFQDYSYQFAEAEATLANEAEYIKEADLQRTQEILNINKKLFEFEKQRIDAKEKYGSGDVYNAEINRINAAADAEVRLSDIRMRGIELQQNVQNEFSEGWRKAFREFEKNSEKYGNLASEVFNSFVNNMNNALDNFVRTGKLNFKDFAKSVIQDILAMTLKFQAMQLLTGAFNFFGLGSSFGAPAAIGANPYAGLIMSGVGKQASGGAIDRPTIVGENGAELFVPRTSGTIIPNGSWQGMAASMGNNGFTNNGTYIASMSAIDTQSATQFLASNKGTIWAAYQSANRSVPISR